MAQVFERGNSTTPGSGTAAGTTAGAPASRSPGRRAGQEARPQPSTEPRPGWRPCWPRSAATSPSRNSLRASWTPWSAFPSRTGPRRGHAGRTPPRGPERQAGVSEAWEAWVNSPHRKRQAGAATLDGVPRLLGQGRREEAGHPQQAGLYALARSARTRRSEYLHDITENMAAEYAAFLAVQGGVGGDL